MHIFYLYGSTCPRKIQDITIHLSFGRGGDRPGDRVTGVWENIKMIVRQEMYRGGKSNRRATTNLQLKCNDKPTTKMHD